MANVQSIEGKSIDGSLHGAALEPPATLSACGREAGVFWASKRLFDIVFGLVALPVVALVAIVVCAINPFANPGPLFFVQTRMGLNGQPFRIVKFRTMLPAPAVCRGPEDPVEVDRITPFGAFLRRTRLDETPQLFNVLKGEMSVIGPRPDIFEHAQSYLRTVPFYRRRCAVRPGITGFAQVTSGYAEGSSGTVEKARRDAIYVRRACWRLELEIVARTVVVMLTGNGAK